MQKQLILSALIGLAGAVGNNGKTENTDRIIMEALLWPGGTDFGRADPDGGNLDETGMVEKIHAEKSAVSPGCSTCGFSCGNTSDYDLSKFDALAPELLAAKERVYAAVMEKAERLRRQGRTELPQAVYKAISYLGYDLELAAYEEMIKEIGLNEEEKIL